MAGRRSFSFNSLLNFSASIFLLAVAFVCLPFLLGPLGVERFGLLTILWLFVGYAAMFDVGIGQATVKYLAQSIGSNEHEEAAGTLRAGVALSLVIGTVGGILLFLASFIRFTSILNISDSLQSEAVVGLRVIALAPPAVLLQGVLKSVPLAFNRFDIANSVLALNGILQWAGSVCVLALGGGLNDVIVLTVAARYVVALILLVVCARLFPQSLPFIRTDSLSFVRKLLHFGGWVSISQVLSPMFTAYERFLIGGLLSLSSVTFFSVPNDVVIRLLTIPMSLVTTLIPFMSGGWGSKERRTEMRLLYQRSIKFLYLFVVPLSVIMAIASRSLLTVWLGTGFAGQAWIVFSVLSVGLLFNALAQLPVASLQAIGRPDIPSKIVLVELLAYGVVCYMFTRWYGIVGTAVAWLLRVSIESGALLFFARRAMRAVETEFDYSYLWKALCFIAPCGGILTMMGNQVTVLSLGISVVAGLTFYAAGTWWVALTHVERLMLLEKVRPRTTGEA